MGQSLCQWSPWCHGVRSLRNLVASTTVVICNDIAHLSLPGDIVHVKAYLKHTRCCWKFTSPNFHEKDLRPKTVESSKKTVAFRCCFVQTAFRPWAWGCLYKGSSCAKLFWWQSRGPKRDSAGICLGWIQWDFIGGNSAGTVIVLKPLVWWNILKRNTPETTNKFSTMTSRDFLTRTWFPKKNRWDDVLQILFSIYIYMHVYIHAFIFI